MEQNEYLLFFGEIIVAGMTVLDFKNLEFWGLEINPTQVSFRNLIFLKNILDQWEILTNIVRNTH
jgi:hypothetical protein